MPEYTYPRPASFLMQQICDEARTQVKPFTRFQADPVEIVFEFDSALSPAEEATLTNVVNNHIPDPLYLEKKNPWRIDPTGILWATIQVFDIPNKKLTVSKTIGGVTFTRDCAVSWSVRHAFMAGEIAVGDKVLVTFVDGDPTQLLALDKIVL